MARTTTTESPYESPSPPPATLMATTTAESPSAPSILNHEEAFGSQSSSSVCLELWHACAGPLISLPKKGSFIVYFPQGHLEQQLPNALPLHVYHLPAHVYCRVIDVKLHAEVAADDRSKSTLTNKDVAKKMKSENICVSMLLGLRKLKSDKRIVPMLPQTLGKYFHNKKKILVPVDLSHKNWKEQIEKACGSTLVQLRY